MKDSEKNTASQEYLFENEFAYASPEGEIKLKENELFEERTVATADPDAIKEKITVLEKAFQNLENKVNEYTEHLREQTELTAGDLQANFEQFMDEVLHTDAIGDFKALAERAQASFEEVRQAKTTETAEEETGTTPQNTAGEKPADTAPAETEAEEASSDEEQESDDDKEEEPEPAETYYQKLAEKAEQLTELTDWAYVSMEFENIDNLWEEGPDPGESGIREYRKKIDGLRENFEEKKKAHYEEQQRIKQENLEKKKELLTSLQEIIENKKWTHTKEVGKIKGRWEQIKSLPAGEAEKLQSSFNSYISVFNDHKVDRLVKKKQEEEDNLTGKLVILEKMEEYVQKLDSPTDWKDAEKKFAGLTKQFRKIGRIPMEKNQEVWDRYHAAQDTFHSMRFKYDSKYRNDIEKFLAKKKKLIDEAEALIDADDLADAARKVNKLHRRWKKAGNLPQKEENEMWERFKKATDAFNEKKSENIDLLRDQEEENYHVKIKLIEEAEELKESEDWEKTHKEFQKLMDRWKVAGPVPKRKSGKIWKKFKGAMDYFYDRRREHFKEVKEERKDNLKEKEEILARLSELKSDENAIEAVQKAKPLQEEFKKAGYVPIKHKNRLWKEYREICDVIYDRFRAAKAAADIVGRENVDHFTTDDLADIQKKQNEAGKLKKKISKLSGELIQMKESLSYFKPTGGGSSLLDDVKKRIENAEKEIEDKEDRLEELEKEIDLIKKEG